MDERKSIAKLDRFKFKKNRVIEMIPYARQWIDDDDVNEVVKVLRSEYLTQGPIVNRFEEIVSSYCGAPYAIAVSNATAGLHLACLSIGLTANDYLWTSPITFVSSANCALFCGANIDFVDIDYDTGNISTEKLEVK